jgi:hypothetical protein
MAWNKETDTVAAARYLGFAVMAGLVACAGQVAAAAAAGASDSIYTCIDSKGRRLTADRPIPDCIDRLPLLAFIT